MTIWPFKPRYTVCKECGTLFASVTGYEAQWGHLCAVHRKPVRELAERKDRVMRWAETNWERLEKQAIEDYDKQQAAYNESRARMHNIAVAQQMAAAGSPLSGFVNIFGMGGL